MNVTISIFDGNIDDILEHIPLVEGIGYAGYSEKAGLKRFLEWSVPGKLKQKPIDKQKTRSIIRRAVDACSAVIEHPLRIFVFPTFDENARDLCGVKGFSPWKNTIIINLYPLEGWEQALRDTVGHEIAHAVAQNVQSPRTIGEWLVWDGLAERFREAMLGGEKAPWVQEFSKEEALGFLEGIDLKSEDEELHKELFYGSERFPRWAGYAAGYWLTADVTGDWKQILKRPLKEFLDYSSHSFPVSIL